MITGIIFTTFDINKNQKKHDPLVAIASKIGGECELSKDDRIKILNFFYNSIVYKKKCTFIRVFFYNFA